MKSDRELLELAAKAAGVVLKWTDSGKPYTGGEPFNPLTDDGDALRLAVNLFIDVAHDNVCGKKFVYVRSFVAGRDPVGLSEIFESECDRQDRTRRAIVRAAASIGEAMQ